MTTTFVQLNRHSIATYITTATLVLLLFGACKKDNKGNEKNKAYAYSSEVLDKWMTLQLRLMRNAAGIPNHGLARHFAYSGIAAIEALEPGMRGHQKWNRKWNGLSGLPAADYSKDYYYPANVNAAMAAINKRR